MSQSQPKTSTSLLARLHNRLGDFWWYSLMMFIALRCGDVINAIVGLWLVPKYVHQDELGAVLPLTQFATTFGLPISILVLVFTKYLAQFKAKGELGKVKSLLRWFIGFVLLASLLSIALAKFTLPALFERIHIQDGSLTLLIIATGIIGTVAPVFNNALQGLKKFKTITLLNLIGAPIRLVSMLLLLPIRALSGYMAGQLIPSIVAIITSTFSIRKDIDKSIVSVPFWRDDLKPILKYLWFATLLVVPGTICGTIQSMIIRQRLPEVESAAYYLLSRFSELAGYAGTTLAFVMFPMAVHSQENKTESWRLLFRMTIGTFAFGVVSTIVFWIWGDFIFTIIPSYHPYVGYAKYLAFMALIQTFCTVSSNYATYELAQGRFDFLWSLLIAAAKAFILVTFCGYGFFYGMLPNYIVDWMASCHVATLRVNLWLMFWATIATTILYSIQAYMHYRKEKCYENAP